MSKKTIPLSEYTHYFSEPGCSACEHRTGTLTQYCGGFKKRRNPIRFTSQDPKLKAPKWCPKRLNPSVIRVYRYKGEMATHFGNESLYFSDKNKSVYDAPFVHHYALAFEHPYGVTAEAFYESTQTEGVGDIYGFELQYGDVVEVDSGLKAHAFVYKGQYTFKPAIFDSTRVENRKM